MPSARRNPYSRVITVAALASFAACTHVGVQHGGPDATSFCAVGLAGSDASADAGEAGLLDGGDGAARDAAMAIDASDASDASDGGAADAPPPADVRPAPAQLAGGEGITCARLSAGGVDCWGWNASSELGVVTMLDFRATPDAVPDAGAPAQITTGGRHVCAREADGSVRCWGRNAEGQLGRGQMSPSEVSPADALCVTHAVDVVAGGSHTCARLGDANNTVVCWGYNSAGQLGDSTTTNRSIPVLVNALPTNVAQLALGAFHSCARTMDGNVYCWGDDTYGQCGTDPTPSGVTTPTMVPGLSNVADIFAGGYHTCARSTDGTVKCWGRNNAGQLGDGTQTDRATPAAVAGLSGAASLALGVAHSCALRTDHTVSCWGWNQSGQIGDTAVPFSATPENVAGLTNVASLIAGWEHTCVVGMDGTARCFGSDAHGQLGDGLQVTRAIPAPVMF